MGAALHCMLTMFGDGGGPVWRMDDNSKLPTGETPFIGLRGELIAVSRESKHMEQDAPSTRKCGKRGPKQQAKKASITSAS